MTRRTPLAAIAALLLASGCTYFDVRPQPVRALAEPTPAATPVPTPTPTPSPTLAVLAHTTTDAETGKVLHRVALRWEAAPPAEMYEVHRGFERGPMKALATTTATTYEDQGMAAGQEALYEVRALRYDRSTYHTTARRGVKVPAAEIAAPALVEPADGAVFAIDDKPVLRWGAVAGAARYHVRVERIQDGVLMYGALTSDLAVFYGTGTTEVPPLLTTFFRVGSPVGFRKGFVYRWRVDAVRSMGPAEPSLWTAVDVRESEVRTFTVL